MYKIIKYTTTLSTCLRNTLTFSFLGKITCIKNIEKIMLAKCYRTSI